MRGHAPGARGVLQSPARIMAVTNLSRHENSEEDTYNQSQHLAGGSVPSSHSLMLPSYYCARKAMMDRTRRRSHPDQAELTAIPRLATRFIFRSRAIANAVAVVLYIKKSANFNG